MFNSHYLGSHHNIFSFNALKIRIYYMKYNKSGSLYRFLHNFIFSESLLHGGSYGAGIVAGNQSKTYCTFWSGVVQKGQWKYICQQILNSSSVWDLRPLSFRLSLSRLETRSPLHRSGMQHVNTLSMFYKRHPIRDIVLILERLRDRL